MITEIEVQGYRLLNEFKANLGPLTVAIGANATGKSTLQDLLRLVCQAAERPINTVLKSRGGMYSVLTASPDVSGMGWRITFTKPTANPVWASLPIDDNRELVYEASLVAVPGYYGAVPQYEALRYAEPTAGHDSPFNFLEYRDGISRVFDFETHRLIDFGEHLAEQQDLFSGLEEEATPSGKPADGGLKGIFEAAAEGPSLLLAQVRYPQRFLQVSVLRMFFASWAFYPGFCVDEYSPIRTSPRDVEPGTVLFPRGENLAAVLHELLTRHEYMAAAQGLRDWLHSAYQDTFDAITAETVPGTKGKVAIRWHEKGLSRPLDAFDLSDGVLRFLCLAAVLNNPRPCPLVVIDEPEVGLHPKLLPVVADMLKAAAEHTQVLVTTHSPDLLDSFSLDDVAVMVREERSVRWHRPSSRRTLRLLLESVEGESLGELHRTGELEAGA